MLMQINNVTVNYGLHTTVTPIFCQCTSHIVFPRSLNFYPEDEDSRFLYNAGNDH